MHHKNCKPLEGLRFGRLLVISRAQDAGPLAKWNCVCDCGNTKVVYGSNLRKGATKSCGCIHRELFTKHGRTNHPLYKVWRGMIARCTEPTARGFNRYGGRGITVCDRWRESFEDFASDMGPRPTRSHTLDRRDNDGQYEPSNCRWATKRDQALNRPQTVPYVVHGLSETLGDWARICGVTRTSIAQWSRRYGIPIENAIRRYLARIDPSLA